MKKIYLVLFVGFISVKSFSQSLIPSTYNQIYNFTIGDTLEYIFHIQLDDSYHSYSNGYVLFNITGVSQDTANVICQVHSDVSYTSVSNPLYYPHYGNLPPFGYSLNLKDSSIFYGLIGLDTMCNPSYDSVFINQDYNGNKQNELVRMCFESNRAQKYVDSLGQVSSSDLHTTGGSQWEGQSQTLIYYHKANGKKWGTPFYFNLPNDVKYINQPSTIIISPNPTSSSFTLQLSSSPSTETYFILYDAMGRLVKREEVNSSTTTIPRNNLPSGIYFWQLESANKIMSRGKLVME